MSESSVPGGASPVVFLDIDGVLHPLRPASVMVAPFALLPQLDAWLRTHPAVEVVFSSSWRLEYPLDQLREMFSEDLQPRVVGATPDLGSFGIGHRGREVQAWLAQSGAPARPWRAIDDTACWFDVDLIDRLILCDPGLGLGVQQIGQLDSWASSWCPNREST